jgi:tRNA dimethylallyltransferase
LAGERDLAETVEAVQARTRQFARRQLTWFRSLAECRLVARSDDVTPAEAAHTILYEGRAAAGQNPKSEARNPKQ